MKYDKETEISETRCSYKICVSRCPGQRDIWEIPTEKNTTAWAWVFFNPREYTLKRAHWSVSNAEQASVTIYIFQTWESINTEPKIWRKLSFISSNIHELRLFSRPQRLKVRYLFRSTALFPFSSSELQWDLKFTSSAWSLWEYRKSNAGIVIEKHLYF